MYTEIYRFWNETKNVDFFFFSSLRLNDSNSGITWECVQRESTQLTETFSIFLMPAARNLTKDFHLLNRQGPSEKKKKGKQMVMCRSDLIHNASGAHSLTPFLFSNTPSPALPSSLPCKTTATRHKSKFHFAILPATLRTLMQNKHAWQ